MPRRRLRKRARRRSQHLSESSCNEIPLATSEDDCDLPGFYFNKITKRYFRIDKTSKAMLSNKSPSSVLQAMDISCLQKNPSVKSFPNLSMLRQHGLLQRPFFNMAIESQLRAMDVQKSYDLPRSLHAPGVAYTCQTVLTNADMNLVASMWSVNSASTSLLFQRCFFLQRKKRVIDIKDEGICTHPQISQYFQNIALKDSCLVPDATNERHCKVLICFTGSKSQAALLRTCNDQYGNLGSLEHSYCLAKESVYSCAYNDAAKLTVFGMETNSLLYLTRRGNQEQSTIFTGEDSVFCVAFDAPGKLVFSGTRRGVVYCSDMRCSPTRKYVYKIVLKRRALRSLRILNNGLQFICSSDEHQLLNVDLRMKRPLMSYLGHVNDCYKIPFTLDEDFGVLCSMGQDGRTRLWNINSGLLVKTIDSPVRLENGTLPFAVFKSSWGPELTLPSVILGYNNKAYIYSI